MRITRIPPGSPAAADATAPRSAEAEAEAAMRPAPATGGTPDGDGLSGASFLQQEPALARELGLTAREMSGWAAAGSGVPE